MTEALPVRGARRAATAVTLVYVVIAILLLPLYGPTWDAVIGEYGAGEKLLAYVETGDASYLEVYKDEPRPERREPHPDFPSRFALHQVSTLNSIASALSCRILWTELHVMPAMQAHNFAIVVFVAVLLFVLVLVVGRRFGLTAAVLSGGFLVTCPRFGSHAFNNLKDAPVACLYALAVLACVAAMRRGRKWTWALAGLVTGLALASKANALFVPFHALAIWVVCRIIPRSRGELRLSPTGLAIAAATFFAAFVAVSPDVWHFGLEAVRLRLDAITAVGYHGDGISVHGLEHFLWTTPIPILAFAVLGLLLGDLRVPERAFLALGIAVPVGRTLLPGMVNFDGVRHFLEFTPFLAAAAGIGAAATIRLAACRAGRMARVLAPILGAVALAPSLLAFVNTAPNGVCYFNALVGGLGGAQERGIHDATDYWGNSYWQGLDWLNTYADAGDRLTVPLAGFIARAAAPVRLRADIELLDEERPVDLDRTTWVMYVTREGGYGPFLRVADRTLRPTHEIRVQGGTILRILNLHPDDPAAREAWAVLRRKLDANAAHEGIVSLTGSGSHCPDDGIVNLS